MSYCVTVKLPTGELAFVRMSGRRPPPCATCGASSTRACDWIIKDTERPHPPMVGRAKARRPRKTCSKPLCDACTSAPAPNKDLCPAHAAAWRVHLERKKTQTEKAPQTESAPRLAGLSGDQ